MPTLEVACDVSICIFTFDLGHCKGQGHPTVSQTVRGQTLLLPTNMKSNRLFDWHIYIWHWLFLKVNIMHISSEIISKTVTDTANIVIADKLKIKNRLSLHIWHLHLTIAILNGNVTHNLKVNISQPVKGNTITIKYQVTDGPSIDTFRFDLGPF